MSPSSRIAPTARNAAILRAARDVLRAALTVTITEQATRAVELAPPAAPSGPYLERLRWRLRWRIGVLFAFVDLVAALLAWMLVPTGVGLAAALVPIAAVLLVTNRTELHRSRLELSVLDDLPAYLLAAVVAGGSLAVITDVGTAAAPRADHALGYGAAVLCLLTLLRAVSYALARSLRRGRVVSHPVLIVGAGEVGQRLAAAMQAHPEYGLRPVGFIDSDVVPVPRRLSLPIFGNLAAMPRALAEHNVNDIVFAFGTQPDAAIVRVVRACVRMDRQVFVVPRYFELWGSDRRARVEVIWGVPLVRLRRWALRPGRIWAKRWMDVGLSGAALAVMSPIMALTALAVRLELGRGVIFRQVRIGRDGRPFTLLKFRSMPTAPDVPSEGDVVWNIDTSPRLGPVGRFIRRTGVDELPQLINILRGDMSLVGPRPERPHFVTSFGARIQRYTDRHRAPTGLTGWAQINGLRGDTSIQERVTFDNYYIDNWTLWSDVKIMVRTLSTFLRREPVPNADTDSELVDAVATPRGTR